MLTVFLLGFLLLVSSISASVLLEALLMSGLFVFFVSSFSNSYYFFYGASVDKLSMLLICLSLWLFVILFIMATKYLNSVSFSKYKTTLVFLSVFLVFTFFFKDLLGFYMFFELSLVPLMFIIFGWGYQVERIQAAFYLLMYTLVGSLPLLVVFIFLFQSNTLFWLEFTLTVNSNQNLTSSYMVLLVSLSLLVKLPMYGLHLWLPKAHVEAPVAGSMVLAAILLKLSAYGFYRVLFFFGVFIWGFHWFLGALIFGALVSSIIALRQTDMKSLVAYSSISHMGVMLSGVICFSSISLKGALIILLGHGFCSSALFYLVNFHYERSYSRQMLLSSGQMNFFTFMAIWWFLFFIVNFSAPPFLNLMGEVLIMAELSFINIYFMLGLMLTSFVVAAFCLFVYSSIFHGKLSSQWVLLGDMGLNHLVLSFHFIPLILMIFKLELLWF